MKVILSRKGFDGENGGIPSPIFPNGEMISFPIPDQDVNIKFIDLKYKKKNYFELIHSLQRNKKKYFLNNSDQCHLDPDIYSDIIEKGKGWAPLFGPGKTAKTHLKNNNVKINDLFLFFGWFRYIKERDFRMMYDKSKSYNLNVIFGYMQIGRIITSKSDIKPWMLYHPHIVNPKRQKDLYIYLARDRLSWNADLPGASPFYKIHDKLILTKKLKTSRYLNKSKWYFTKEIFKKKINITYHSNNNWKPNYFQSTSRGQEFIMEEIPIVEKWAKNLIEQSYDR